MEESFRQVGYDLGFFPVLFYFAMAAVVGYLAFRNRENKTKWISYGSSSVGFVLAGLLNLPSPWGVLPVAVCLLAGTAIGAWCDSDISNSHRRIYFGFSIMSIIVIVLLMWFTPNGSFTIALSQVTQYDQNGKVWAQFSKRAYLKVRAYRSKYFGYFLWSVSNPDQPEHRSLHLAASEIYWNRKYGFINGDQLALRIAEWAETPVEVGDWVNKVPEKTAP